jgi:DNA-binding transcriptional MerR regulator
MVGADPKQQEFSIGQVAERTGLSVHALRYYEREGLMLSTQIPRTGGRNRRYSATDLEWLDICVKLRTSGMPLAKIRRYAELVREGPGNEPERLELLREHQRQVATQVAQLNECLDLITRKAEVYEQHLARGAARPLWTAGG